MTEQAQPEAFRHIGPICHIIRHSQERLSVGPDPKAMAIACDVTTRAIERFEAGERLLQRNTFLLYVKALGLHNEKWEELLLKLYESQRWKEERESKLSYYDFSTIVEATKTTYQELYAL